MSDQWIVEQLHPFYRKSLSYQTKLLDEQTEYQHIQVFQTEFFGNVMLLDGIIQLTERDNAGYHEMISHVPLLAQKNPTSVLIVGGGDGGTLQQVLRYPSVEQAVLCELDQRVVEAGIEYFPQFGNPFSDSRVELVIKDAFLYLQDSVGQFDVIIADTTDPIGAAEKLFTPEFYRLMVNALKPYGAITTQCEQMFFDVQLIKEMMSIAQALVEHPAYYHTLVPTYPGGGIGFLYMSNTPWTDGLNKPYPGPMHYLTPDIHRAAFACPQFFKDALAA
ncbi:MAG: polyamine aminopropyltransferase [Anaerolineae bacterium]|nr:polyamine aminopropyltransferase [Anaerolineae bacterium]